MRLLNSEFPRVSFFTLPTVWSMSPRLLELSSLHMAHPFTLDLVGGRREVDSWTAAPRGQALNL